MSQYACLNAQFYDVTAVHGLYIYNDNSVWENGVSFHDFDRDGFDDLTYTSNNNGVFTFRNTGGSFEQVYYFPAIMGRITTPIWVDYDNDGDADFFATRALDCPVLWRNNGDMTFEDVSGSIPCPMDGVISTTATWGDFDNDGLLDVHIGNYNLFLDTGVGNWLFRNLGNGNFEEVSLSVGLNDGPGKSYQCVFLDADFDRDQDLLVVHDKNLGCRFFLNQGGWFEDIGVENGFDVHLDAMSLSVSDFDQDGDYDYFISNIVDGNFFLVNDEGIFTNQAESLNVEVNANCWGSIFIDSKNTTYEDLYVVSTGPATGLNVLLQNAQGAEFLPSYSEFGNADDEYIWAVAKGDYNSDGSYDVISLPYLANGSLLFESSGSASNWIKINLSGTQSNRDGIGSTVRCFVGGKELIRPTTCGENFQSQDSKYLIFGLQDYTAVDSLIVEWPSGLTDTHHNLDVNQFYTFIEGETVSFADVVSQYFICPQESITLTVDDLNFQSWDNGSADTSLNVSEPGVYNAIFSTQWGASYLHSFFVEEVPLPEWSTSVAMPTCNGYTDGLAVIQIDTALIESVHWFDGSNELQRDDLASGLYSVEIITANACTIQVEIAIPEPEPILVQNDLYQLNCFGQYVTPNLEFIGGMPPYDVDWNGLNPLQLQPGSHAFNVHDSEGCDAEFLFEVEWLPEIIVTLNADNVCPGSSTSIDYSASGGSGNLVFDFDEIDPDNVGAGYYQVVVTDDEFCYTQQSITIEEFDAMENTAIVSNAQNGSNGGIEIITTGGLAPYSYDWSNGQNQSQIYALSQGEYSCIVTDANGCFEELTISVIDLSVESNERELRIFPRPFRDHIKFEFSGEHAFKLYDVLGKEVSSGNFLDAFQLDTSACPPGSYLLVFDNVQTEILIKE